MYKTGADLDLFLRRWENYAQAVGIQEQDRVFALLSLMDDVTLAAIERHLANQEVTYQELVAILRRETGLEHPNREAFIKELRNRRRQKGESVRTFYQSLYQLAKKSYPGPENEAVAANALRENFIYNLADHYISSRLREHPEMTNEDLLQLAVTLEACKPPASSSRGATMLDINAAHTPSESGMPGSVTGEADKKKGNSKKKDRGANLDTLAGMMEDLSTQMSELRRDTIAGARKEPYHPDGMPDNDIDNPYQGSRISPGLYPATGTQGYWEEPTEHLRW